ncbi:MAG: glycosyl transferase [Chloroflexi bacterium]|nr:glycosyl transferase [Chloroflexota bacterium]
MVAHNCDDETAAVARRAGALVMEYHHPDQVGKGYALVYGLRLLADTPPEVVVVLDADCQVEPRAFDHLVRCAWASGRPVQGSNCMKPPPDPRPRDLVSALAVHLKNFVRPSGLTRLGLPCLLTGSGMAFPWQLIHEIPIAGDKLAEDMQLTVDLALAGTPPIFCPQAQTTSRLPQRQTAALEQRTRWEHGHLETIQTQAPRLWAAAWQQRRFDLAAIALDLAVPPLTFLASLTAGALILAVADGVWAGRWGPAIVLGTGALLLLMAVGAGWARYGRVLLPIRDFWALTLYFVWKVPVYLTFFYRRQKKWIRTGRDHE